MNRELFLFFCHIVLHLKQHNFLPDTEIPYNDLLDSFRGKAGKPEQFEELGRKFRAWQEPYKKYSQAFDQKLRSLQSAPRFSMQIKGQLQEFYNQYFVENDRIHHTFPENLASYISSLSQYIEPSKNQYEQTFNNNRNTLFYNSCWFYYILNDEDITDNPYSIVKRLFLYFDDNSRFALADTEEKNDSAGIITESAESRENYIELRFNKGSYSEANMQLRFGINGPVRTGTVLIGQYIKSDGIIIKTGTCIIENVSDKINGVEMLPPDAIQFSGYNCFRKFQFGNRGTVPIIQTELGHHVPWKEFIPWQMASYLSHQRRNFKKTKPLDPPSDLNAFGRFLDKQKQKPFQEYKFNSLIAFDLFLLAPKYALDTTVLTSRQAMEEDIERCFFLEPALTIKQQLFSHLDDSWKNAAFEKSLIASEQFRKRGIHRIYHAQRESLIFNEPHLRTTSKNIIERELEIMKQSRFVVYISPANVPTSALIKIGWALHMEKPIFVFPLQAGAIPDLIHEPYKKIIEVFPVCKIADIPGLLLNKVKPNFAEGLIKRISKI